MRYLGMVKALDPEIFQAARSTEAIVLTKNEDFVVLLERFGPPPHVLWVRCGNTSNAHMREVLRETLPDALALIAKGEPLVEIRDVGMSRRPTRRRS